MHNWHQWAGSDGHYGGGGWRGMFQARRGDISPLILRALAERPMHGYEIIRHLEDKSHGLWRPSPGSVYPTLQLLEEQDLVTATDQSGKKVYEITEKGRAEAKNAEQKAPWEWDEQQLARIAGIKTAIVGVIGPFKSLARGGDEQTFAAALKIMQNTSDALNKLAKDAPSGK